MSWLQIRFEVSKGDADLLSEALESVGALAVTLQSAGSDNLFDQVDESPTLWETTALTALFPADTDPTTVTEWLAARLAPTKVPAWTAEVLVDQDWNRAWMDRFHPLRVGKRLWVCPSWHTPPELQAVNVILDPGMAFGTGTHPTTAMCLRWLDAADLQGKTVLDYGCGSGILAIAAVKLGARHAHAVDIDPQCLEVTRENAARNGVLDRLAISLARDWPSQQVDVLVANILAGPLIALAPRFAEYVRPGGALGLSGLLAPQAQECLAAYAAFFELQPPVVHDEWVMLSGIRKNR